jgi:hypothetical protein
LENESTREGRTSASATAEGHEDRTEFVVKLPNMFSWVPDEFWTHMRAAGREQMLAMRSLLDAAIERTEEQPSGRRRSRVDITVE